MPKPFLAEPYHTLEHDLVRTMFEGLHYWRPDLDFPESTSDMQGCVRAVLELYKVERRAVKLELPWKE